MIILFACFSIYRYRNLFFEKKKALLDSFSTFRLFAGSQFVVLGASVPHTRTHSHTHTHTHTRILCLIVLEEREREREREVLFHFVKNANAGVSTPCPMLRGKPRRCWMLLAPF